MPGLSIQEWGAIGEIVGGVAVLLTIVYLALELRRSTRATHRQTYQAAAEAMAHYFWNLARHPELHTLYRETLQNPDALSDEELRRGFLVLDAYLALMESFYLHNLEFRERESQVRWAKTLVRLLSTPGGARYWHRRRWQFHRQFADYVEALRPRA